MKSYLVKRISILEKIVSITRGTIDNPKAQIIKIIGRAGTGKSTLLSQLQNYFNYKGIFPQTYMDIGKKEFSLIQSLQSYQSHNPGNNDNSVIKQILSLRDRRKDFLLYILDDVHEINHKILNEITSLFHDQLKSSRFILILAGRPGFSDDGIVLDKFSTTEAKDYLNNIFYSNWTTDFVDVTQYLFKVSDKHPYYLSLITKYLINIGAISQTYCEPVDKLKLISLPESLSLAIKSTFNIDELHHRQIEILKYLAVIQHSISKNLINKWIKTKENDFSLLSELNWINIDETEIVSFAHPLIRELILKEQIPLNKIRINILKYADQISNEEKAHLLMSLEKYSIESRKQLLDYANSLENKGDYYLANRVYQKINKKNDDPEIIYKQAKNYFEIGELDTAKLLYGKISEEYKKKYLKSEYYLGKICVKEGDFEKAEKYFYKCYKGVSKTSKNYSNILIELAWVNANLHKKDKLLIFLKKIKALSDKGHYYKIVCQLSLKYPIEQDILKIAKKGLKLSYKTEKLEDASLFEQTLCNQYIGMGDFVKAEFHGNNSENISKSIHDLDGETIAVKTKAVISAKNGFIGRAIEYQKKALGLRQHQNIKKDIPDTIQALATLFGMAGHLPELENYIYKLEALTKGHLNSVNLIPKFTLASLYFQLNRIGNSKKLYLHVHEYCKANKIDLLIAYCQLELFQLNYDYYPEKAERQFDEAVHILVYHNRIDHLNSPFYNRCWVYAEAEQPGKIENTLNKWKKIMPNIPLFNIEVATLLKEILENNIRSALTRVVQLENKFDGTHLLEYIRLYKFLTGIKKIPSKQKNKFLTTFNLLTSISKNSSEEKIKIHANRSKFESLIYEWHECITQKRMFDRDILERFTKDNSLQLKLIDLFRVWNIYCNYKDETEAAESNYTQCKINILGPLEIFVHGKKITKAGLKSKRTLEILVYLIIKGWVHQNSVSLEDLIKDVWNAFPEKVSSARNSRKVIISRLRSMFKDTGEDMIPVIGDSITFNWTSDCCSLDMDIFWELSQSGMRHFNSGDLKNAIEKFELAIESYRGDLAYFFDFIWLESLRAEFLQKYLETIKNLIKCYKQINEEEKIDNLYKKVDSVYPNDPYIKDLFSS